MTLTKDEAKGRFQTVTSAEEMADLLLECFQVFGHDGTEQIIIEIKEGEALAPLWN